MGYRIASNSSLAPWPPPMQQGHDSVVAAPAAQLVERGGGELGSRAYSRPREIRTQVVSF